MARKTTKADELDAALQSAICGRRINMIYIPKLRPEAEERIKLGADIPTAARLAVDMYAIKDGVR